MKRIAVLTSGGDAAGMNAAIRAVVRTAIDKGWETFGVCEGFDGLLNSNFKPLGARDVGGIINRGGTVLGSARCQEFTTSDAQQQGIRNLESKGISGLVVIGGNGSQTGSNALSQSGFPVVGVASTIDNDLYGSDITLGVDTALNIALESIDRLRTTASSLNRAFFVEIMGRDCGYLALTAGIVGGAEAIVIPEAETTPEQVADELRHARDHGKCHAIVVVAEGAKHDTNELRRYFEANQKQFGYEVRATVLGHVQRGGVPSAFDRMLGSRFGAAATECFSRNEFGVLVGLLGSEVRTTPLTEVAANKKELDLRLLELAQVLAK